MSTATDAEPVVFKLGKPKSEVEGASLTAHVSAYGFWQAQVDHHRL